jgi:signal peptidase
LVLLLLALAALVLVAVPQATGWQTYTLPSSSMASTYPPGTFLVVQPAAFSQLKHGDTVAFELIPGRPEVGARQVAGFGALQGEQILITKGANNDVVPVHARQVRGKLLYAVPLVGHLTEAVINADPNLWLTLAAVGLIGQGALVAFLSLRRRQAGRGNTGP